MNKPSNTGVRCDSIQSGDTTSSQVYQYQVASLMCHISGVR